MLITCKACAAVNFIQFNRAKRGDAHCTICKKVLDLTTPEPEPKEGDGFRISQNPTALNVDFIDDQKTAVMPRTAIGNMLAESVGKVPAAPMWGKDDDGHTSPDPLMLSEIERKLESMNSKQRLALAAVIENDEDYEPIDIEDEEEEELDMSPSIKLPMMDLARWNSATVPSIPAERRRQHLNQRLTLAAWIFVAGLGTAGVAGAAVAHTTAATPEKKTATAALAEIAAQQKAPASGKSPR